MAGERFTPGPWTAMDTVHGDRKTIFNAEARHEAFVCTLISGSKKGTDRFDADACLIAAAPELYAALDAILRHGELANVDAGASFYPPGGKKPASKDVWQFPRHMLPELEAALAKARGEP